MAKLSTWVFDRPLDTNSFMTLRKVNRGEHNKIWLFSAIITVVTFNHLFEVGYIFPMRLLLVHATIAFLLKQLYPAQETSSQGELRFNLFTLICTAINIISTAGALIFTYQATLHLRNGVLLTMLLTLSLPYLDHSGKLGRASGIRLLTELIPRYGLLMGCMVTMFLYENQLTKKGITSTIAAVVSVAIVRLSAIFGASEFLSVPRISKVSAHTCGLVLALPIATIVLILAHEVHPSREFLPFGHLLTLAANLIAGSVTLMFGTPFKRLALEDGCIPENTRRESWGGLLMVVILALDNASLKSLPFDTSIWQWFAYGLAYVASVECTRRSSGHVYLTEDESYERQIELGQEPESAAYPSDDESDANDAGYGSSRAPLFFILSIIPILLVVYHGILSHQPTSTPEFPPLVGTNRSLDIVFARYDEKVEDVAALTEQILALPMLADMAVRVVMYNKGNASDSWGPLKSVTHDLVVRNIPNVDKEGETYISHILNEWDDLAPHTMFLQAEPHEPRQLLERMRDYFGPDTGFLGLSYTRGYCESCDRCSDWSTWYGKPKVFHDIYEKSNKKPCEAMSLTYRGQFIVSRDRIRNLDRDFLTETREKHLADYRYGYTFERMWGVFFQCTRISSTCPTLDSGSLGHMGSGGRADCQCLDIL